MRVVVNYGRFMCRMSEERRMEAVSERPTFVGSSIPVEIVDDDELAAIEAAFLHASSSLQCSLPFPKSYAPSSIRALPLQRSRSLAESANYWLTQCLNRVNSLDSGQHAKPLLEVHPLSSTRSSTEISLPSNPPKGQSSCCKDSVSIKCCSSHEGRTLVSLQSTLDESNRKGDEVSDVEEDLIGITAQVEHSQGQIPAIPIIQDIEDLPSVKNAAKSQTEDVPLEPKPRCLSVTDFTAFVSSLFIL